MTKLPDTNPKTRFGMSKPGISSIPPIALLHCGRGMDDGKEKYGLMNWREHEVSASVYYNAAFRHLAAWYEGEQCAPDSGVHHLGHVMACCAILLDAEAQGQLNDDRPEIPGNFGAMVAAMTRPFEDPDVPDDFDFDPEEIADDEITPQPEGPTMDHVKAQTVAFLKRYPAGREARKKIVVDLLADHGATKVTDLKDPATRESYLSALDSAWLEGAAGSATQTLFRDLQTYSQLRLRPEISMSQYQADVVALLQNRPVDGLARLDEFRNMADASSGRAPDQMQRTRIAFSLDLEEIVPDLSIKTHVALFDLYANEMSENG